MYLGSAWYPEHWDESYWEQDVQLMQEAGFNVVRLAEFAWSKMEPEEGRFELDWLDRVVELAARYGVESILGTPSASPPAWLTHKYPETLVIDINGKQAKHGRRQHVSPSSPLYKELSVRIAEEMAKRFGRNLHVIAWQIDNEFGPVSYDDETRRQWQQWLKYKHGTLKALNDHWCAAFWSQEYTAWEQIPLPAGFDNPQFALDFKRFMTHVYKTFQGAQIEVIRKHGDPRQLITHNFMGIWPDTFDHYELAADLDIASWDDYVWGGQLPYHVNGCSHDFIRSLKRKNFWVLETQQGRTCASCSLDKGASRTLTWHHIGHGADASLYWEWRYALGGQEYYSGVAVMQDSKPSRVYSELQQIGRDFAKASPVLEGTSPVSQVAMIHTYDDRWLIDACRYQNEFDPINHTAMYHKAIRGITHEVDFVRPTDSLDGYKLVIAPNLEILGEDRLENLTRFIESGGHLVLGARSGGKDVHGRWLESRQPGPLAGLLGAHVDEYYWLHNPIPVSGKFSQGEARIWAELLEVDSPDAEVLMHYGSCNGWLDGQAAAVTKSVGKGRITYIGTWFGEETMNSLAQWLVEISGVESAFGPVPDGIEVCRRVGDGREVFIIINHSKAEQTVNLPKPMKDVLTDTSFSRSAIMPALGVMALV